MARDFSGTAQYLTGGAVITAAPFTMCCFFYLANTTGTHILMSAGVLGTNDNRFTLSAQGAVVGDPIRFTSRVAAASNADSSSGYSASVWGHAAAVAVSTTDRTVYRNGAATGVNTTLSTPLLVDSVRIGASSDAANPTTGRIAEAAIWNVALTAAEVMSLSRGISPMMIRPLNLLGYWPLSGIASPENDLIGSFPLTLTGTPTVADHVYSGLMTMLDNGYRGNYSSTAAFVAAGLAAGTWVGQSVTALVGTVSKAVPTVTGTWTALPITAVNGAVSIVVAAATGFWSAITINAQTNTRSGWITTIANRINNIFERD